MDTDSLWLQKSINLSDPFADESSSVSQGAATKPATSALSASAIEGMATRPPAETANNDVAMTTRSTQPTVVATTSAATSLAAAVRAAPAMRASTARMHSLASVMSSFSSPFEVEELKSKIVQLNREKLKLDDAVRDLDRLRGELQQAREDYKTLEEYTQGIKSTADDCSRRAERDAKARQEAESKLLDAMRSAAKEQQTLKASIDEVKKEQAHALFGLKEQCEAEKMEAIAALESAHEEAMAALQERVDEAVAKVSNLEEQLRLATAELAKSREDDAAHQRVAEEQKNDLMARTEELKADLAAKMAEHQRIVDQLKLDHLETVEFTKALATEQVHLVKEEAHTQRMALQQKLDDIESQLKTAQSELAAAQRSLLETNVEMQSRVVELTRSLEFSREESRTEISRLHTVAAQNAEAHAAQVRSLQTDLADVRAQLKHASEQLADRERDIRAKAAKVDELQAEVRTLEDRVKSAVTDIEVRDGDIEELTQMIRHLTSEKETVAQGFAEDLHATRNRMQHLDAELTLARAQLSAERKTHLAADAAQRKAIADLQEQLCQQNSSLVKEHAKDIESRTSLQLTCDGLNDRIGELSAEIADLRQRRAVDVEENRTLASENQALRGQCQTLQLQLEDLANAAAQQQAAAVKRPRELSNVNANVHLSREPSMKRNRIEERSRAFAVSGFEGADLDAIKQAVANLPNAKLVECKSNGPIPDEVTHLVASGTLTVKLLTAAAKGCWIVSKKYVDESAANQQWLSEDSFGFRHDAMPFKGKLVYWSQQFKASKHYSTAKLVLEQGGAIPAPNAEEADMVLSSAVEASRNPELTSWEMFVRDIYPALVA